MVADRNGLQRPDFLLFGDILSQLRPTIAVELGTGALGITPFFAHCQKQWQGKVWTFDTYMASEDYANCRIAETKNYPNMKFFREDVLRFANKNVVEAIRHPNQFIFCDNGCKELEMALYGPYLGSGGILACHDYGHEVDPEWAEIFMPLLGFEKYREEDAKRLDGEQEYGSSRFWKRK